MNIEINPEKLQEICYGMPKVELHCHLFGTVRKETFIYLNEKAGHPISDKDIEMFYKRGEKPVGVLRVLRALDSDLIREANDLYLLTSNYLEDASGHNVRYSEFFWNPTGTVMVSKIPYKDAQDAIIRAIEDGEKKYDITGRLICAIDRESPPEYAIDMVDWMVQYPSPLVIGIGIDYSENDRPPELFCKAYGKARLNGFKLTAHAGEFGMPWNNVDCAINSLKVDRVDHGYTVLQNNELVDQVLKENIIFTVVPTNSYYLRTLPPDEWAMKHPIREMVKRGIRVHPNTDDPTLHKVTPTESWMMMVKYFGCDIEHLRQFMINGLDAAWIDDNTKSEWKREWPKFFDPYLSGI